MEGEVFYKSTYGGIKKRLINGMLSEANATGFGAAADDYMERGIDLNEQLIRNKPATFLMRVSGDSMLNAGIYEGDIVIVDRSIKAASGKIVIATLNGEMLIRRLRENI